MTWPASNVDVVVGEAVDEPGDGGKRVAEDVAGGAADDFPVVEAQDAAGVPQVQVGHPPRCAAEDDGAGGAVVSQGVRKPDSPVLDAGVDDLDGRSA